MQLQSLVPMLSLPKIEASLADFDNYLPGFGQDAGSRSA